MDQQPRVRQVVLATGVSVSYVSAGLAAGAPVVLLHAWGESWRSFDRLLPLLPGTIHAVAMDLRGHGDADKPAAGYSLAEVAADVVAFMDAVGVPSAVLLGSSSGGYVAQQVAITSPHRVAGLVLVGACPPTDTATITAPTLIVWGARDELLTREDQRALAAAIPASRLIVYQDTGHLVLWEQPGRVASDLTAFVDSLREQPV